MWISCVAEACVEPLRLVKDSARRTVDEIFGVWTVAFL
jgi:hypothetical protein